MANELVSAGFKFRGGCVLKRESASSVSVRNTTDSAYADFIAEDITINTSLYLTTAPSNDDALTQVLVRDTVAGEIKYRSASSFLSGLTNGSGTTANGTAIDLGGALSSNVVITGANTYNVTIGTAPSPISELTLEGEIVTISGQAQIDIGALTEVTLGGGTYTTFTGGEITASALSLLTLTANVYSINIVGGPTNGIELVLTSDAPGDMFTRGSDGYLNRIPIGTEDQVMTVVSGVPSWSTISVGNPASKTIDHTDSPYTILEGDTNTIIYVDTTTSDVTVSLDTTTTVHNITTFVNIGTNSILFSEGTKTFNAIDATCSTQFGAVDVWYAGSDVWYGAGALGDIGTGGGSGITTLNTLTATTQSFAVGTTGADFNISSSSSTHTFNLPTASGSVRGALASADWNTFNNKISGSGSTGQVAYFSGSGTITSSGNLTYNSGTTTLTVPTIDSVTIGTGSLIAEQTLDSNVIFATLINSSTGSNAGAAMQIQTDGSGDSLLEFLTSVSWSVGIDQSDSNSFIINNSGGLTGSVARLRFGTDGDLSLRDATKQFLLIERAPSGYAADTVRLTSEGTDGSTGFVLKARADTTTGRGVLILSRDNYSAQGAYLILGGPTDSSIQTRRITTWGDGSDESLTLAPRGGVVQIEDIGGSGSNTLITGAASFYSLSGNRYIGLTLGSGAVPSTADTAWMYVRDIAAGNAAVHFKSENGAVIKMYQPNLGSAYSVSNVTTDRTFDANSYTTDELADVLGTLITDLKAVGIIA